MGEWGGPTYVQGFDRYLEDLLVRFAARRRSWALWSDDIGGFGIRQPDRSLIPHWTFPDAAPEPCTGPGGSIEVVPDSRAFPFALPEVRCSQADTLPEGTWSCRLVGDGIVGSWQVRLAR